jgi:5'-nucleotidase
MILLTERRGSVVRAAMVALLSTLMAGCYFQSARLDYNAGRGAPWWCQGTPDLTQAECLEFSVYLDVAVDFAYAYPTLADFVADGATAAPGFTQPGLGKPYLMGSTAAFDPAKPNVLFFEDDTDGARAVAAGWAVDDYAVGAPEGFDGDRENWQLIGGKYYQSVWVLRGFENHPDVFASAHPCLQGPGGSNILSSTADDCYLASHTEPFEILVTNDDGVMATGIDALVEGLYGLSNVNIGIVAPAANQSGSSDQVTQQPFEVSGSASTTLSGRAATAVASSDPNPPRNGSGSPADSVIYAFGTLMLSPDVVLSGTNKGQNIGPFSALSGTVGAARMASRLGFDAIATSTGGIVISADFPTGVDATLELLEEYRLGNAGPPFQEVLSINIPTCAVGFSVRGAVNTVVTRSDDVGDRPLAGQAAQDCSSTETVVNDDVDAFNFGFISITDVGLFTPPNWE